MLDITALDDAQLDLFLSSSKPAAKALVALVNTGNVDPELLGQLFREEVVAIGKAVGIDWPASWLSNFDSRWTAITEAHRSGAHAYEGRILRAQEADYLA